MSTIESLPAADETEAALIETAQRAISQCRWIVGECASKWTQRHARGRTDADFGQLVGLSADQIYQRRRVWETFSDVRSQFPSLKWSHFYSALNWDDASDCLQWAEETEATVAEMKAWRRALRGEDLTALPEATGVPEEHISYLSGERTYVQDPAEFAAGGDGLRRPGGPNLSSSETDPARIAALARELDPLGGDNYAPFHAGAIQPPPSESVERPSQAEVVSPEQLAKRICSTIERCNKALNSDVLEQLQQLPPKLVDRLKTAVEELTAKLANL